MGQWGKIGQMNVFLCNSRTLSQSELVKLSLFLNYLIQYFIYVSS